MPPTEKTAETMTKRQRWAALALLSAGLVMIPIDMTILFIALPTRLPRRLRHRHRRQYCRAVRQRPRQLRHQLEHS